MTLYFAICHLIWTHERLLGTTRGLGVSHLLCVLGVSNNVWIFPGCCWCWCSKLASSSNILVFLEGFGTVATGSVWVNTKWPMETRADGRYFPEFRMWVGGGDADVDVSHPPGGAYGRGVKRFAVGLRLESCWWCVFDGWHSGGSNGWEWLILILGSRQSGGSPREKGCLD